MKLFLRSTLVFVIACFAPFASAQTDLYWVGGPAGDYSTAANWNTLTSGTGAQLVPGSTNIAVVFPGFNGTTLTGITNINIVTPPLSPILGFQVNNSFNGFDFTLDEGIVSLTNTSNSTLTITGNGTTGPAGTTTPDTVGDLDVDGGTTLTLSGPGSTVLVNKGLIVIGDEVNYPYTGTLNINSGTFSFVPSVGNTTEMDIGSGTAFFEDNTTSTVTQGLTGATPAADTASTVITGNYLNIGYFGGVGTYNVTNGSLLQIGSATTPTVVTLGANSVFNEGGGFFEPFTNSVGSMVISGTSTVNITSGSDVQLGVSTAHAEVGGGSGTITQNGVGSNVNLLGTSTMELGDAAGGSGTYNLQAGTLNIGGTSTLTLGAVGAALIQGTFTAAGNGNLTESQTTAGTTFLIAGPASTVDIGTIGTGTFTFTGGSADFQDGFTVGANGTVTQSGTSVLTAENPVDNEGSYTLNSGTATFSNTFTNNGSLNLNGGKFSVGAASFSGGGSLNFGGGTLKLTSGTTFDDTFAGGTLAAGTVSTIDASLGTFTTVTIAQNLIDGTANGLGGITFLGSDGTAATAVTNFNLTGSNTYTGPTTIDGGVLNVSGASIADSDALNIGVGNNNSPISTVNLSLAAGGFAFPGSISGPGSLNVNFTNTGDPFVVLNTSNFTGAITLGANGTAGTFQVFSGSFGHISDNGTASGVTIGGNPLTPFPAGVSAPSTGTVTFVSPTYTGLTTIYNGFTLNTTDLDGSATLGTVGNPGGALNVTGIGGAGGITGNVVNNGGAVTVEDPIGVTGSLTNNDVGSSFTGLNVDGNVTNAGTLKSALASVPSAPTFTVGGISGTSTFTIGGNLTSTGTLVVRTNGLTADSFVASGATPSSITGAIQISGYGSGTYAIVYTPNNSALVLNVAQPTDTTLFHATLSLNAADNAVILTTVQTPSAIFGSTYNEKQVGTSIDRFLLGIAPVPAGAANAFATFANYYSNLTPAEFPAVQEQLSAESLQYARNIAIEKATILSQSVYGVLANLRGGYSGLDTSSMSFATPGFDSGLGRSMQSLLAYNSPAFHQTAPNGVNYYPQDDDNSPAPSSGPASSPSSPRSDTSGQTISDSSIPLRTASSNSNLRLPAPGFSEFIGGDVILADLNQNSSANNAPSSKASYTAGDVIAGISYRMTSNLAAGVLFDYNHTHAKTDSNGSTTDVDSYSPGLYATYFNKGFYANGLFAFGYNTYSNDRSIPVLGNTATSSPTGQQYTTNLDLGYDFHPKVSWADGQWTVGPSVGLTYTHVNIDSFTESGAGLGDLAVNSQSIDSLRSRLGGHLIYQTHINGILLQPNITAMWQHEYLDTSSGIACQFNELGGASAFTTQTATTGTDSALIGCGLTATLDNSMAFYLNYIADVGASDYFTQSVIGGFKAQF